MSHFSSITLALLLAIGCGTSTTPDVPAANVTATAPAAAAANEEVPTGHDSPAVAPADLADIVATKVAQVEGSKADYSGRDKDVASMKGYLANGKFDMVVFQADKILEQERNLGQGVPESVQSKIDQVEAERVDYPDRGRDIRSMNGYLEKGKYDMVVFQADKILEQQRNLGGDVPPEVQAKVDQVEAERVDYPDRGRDIRSMNGYLEKGKYDMVVFQADKILEQQKNLSAGVPAEVQAKVDQVEAERVDYPNRDRDVRSMNGYLEKGKYDMVVFQADKILEQQRNLK